MSLLEEHQATDLEKITGLSRRRFIGAGALCGAAMFLGGNLLTRTAMANAVSAGNSALLGFTGIAAATSDSIPAATAAPRPRRCSSVTTTTA